MRPNLNFLAKGSFQTTADGQRLFFPNGMAGKGYLIASEEIYQRLLRQQKHWVLSIMATMIFLLSSKLISGLLILAVFLALNLCRRVFVRRTVSQLNMAVSTTPYSTSFFLHDSLPVHKLSPGQQGFLLLCSLLACGVLAWLAFHNSYPEIRHRLVIWSLICALIVYLLVRSRLARP